MQRVLQRILDSLLDSIAHLLHPGVVQGTLRRIGRTLGRIEMERQQKLARGTVAPTREDFLACLAALQRPGAWHFVTIESAPQTITTQIGTCPFGARAAYDHNYCHIEASMLACLAENFFKEATISIRRGGGVPPHDCRVTFHLEPGATPLAGDGLIYAVRGNHREAEGLPDRLETQPAAKLSRREIQILKLITEGLGDKEIAAQLNLSVRTVENHAARIRQKLQIHGRAGLVRYALNHRLTDQ